MAVRSHISDETWTTPASAPLAQTCTHVVFGSLYALKDSIGALRAEHAPLAVEDPRDDA